MTASAAVPAPIRTTVPARLDRLRWTPHAHGRRARRRVDPGRAADHESQCSLPSVRSRAHSAPAFYAALIGDGSSRTGLFVGYLVGAGIMAIGGIIEAWLGINAEGKSLEAVTKPLTAVAEPAAGT